MKRIKEGDLVTVLNWIGVDDNSYKGDCLEIKVIDYPFIRVQNHSSPFIGAHTLNLERTEIKHLSKKFILSVIPDYAGRLPNDIEANNLDDKILIGWHNLHFKRNTQELAQQALEQLHKTKGGKISHNLTLEIQED